MFPAKHSESDVEAAFDGDRDGINHILILLVLGLLSTVLLHFLNSNLDHLVRNAVGDQLLESACCQ